MKKLCYVISDVDSSHQLEAMIRATDTEKFSLSLIFLAREVPTLYRKLEKDGYEVKYYVCRGKKDLPLIFWKLINFWRQSKPDIVHTHLFFASIVGLLAAKATNVKQRIHTRHHSIEHHSYHPHAVKYDKFINSLSTHIVAITNMVADILTEKELVSPEKITVVHHGFDWHDFEKALESSVDLKSEYGLTDNYPIIGVISRHIHWKGIQYIIPTFKELLNEYPKAKLVLANAVGSYHSQIQTLLESLDSSSYVSIEFEKRVFDLFKTFDVFVHVPIGPEYEAFGQVYVEALAMRVPSVLTLSGVASDFIRDEFNALVVPYCDSESISQAITRLLSSRDLRDNLVNNGERSVREMFHIAQMIKELESVYLQRS